MGPRVLIADSEPWAVELLNAAAQRFGAEVSFAANGIEAIERFKRDAPELVVVDSILSKINGLDVSSRLRATAPGRVLPIVLTSALYRREGSRKLQRKHGFSALLEKPFDAAAAGEALARWLGEEDTRLGQPLEPLREILPASPGEERELGGRPLGSLLLELMRERRTAVVTLTRTGTVRQLAFDRGAIVHARSSSPRDRIDRVLARLGRITQDQQSQLEQALRAHPGRIDLVPTLVRLGWLWAEEVKRAVLSQMTQVVIRAALATSGQVRLQAAALPSDLERHELRGAELVFWALRRFDGTGAFRDTLPSPRSFVARAEGAERARAELGLTSLEEQILGLADGRRRVGDLLSIARFGPADVARVLHGLLALGVLVAAAEDRPVPSADLASRPRVEPRGKLVPGRMVELAARLWLEHESGALRIERGDGWREIIFDGGEAVWAASSCPEHWLGAVLTEMGGVTAEDLAEALRVQTESSGRRIGGILLEHKAVTLEELDRARRTQIQRIVVDALSWRDGDYSFEARAVSSADRVTLALGTPELVLDGARRNPAPAWVAALLTAPDAVLLKVWDSDQIERVLRLERPDKLVVDALEAGRPAAELLTLELMPREDLLRLLHGLLSLEVLRAVRGHIADKEDTPEGAFVPSDLVGDLVDSGVLPTPQGDEISGVIRLGAVRAQAPAPDRLQALERENAELRRRLAELEALVARRSGR